MNEHIFTFGYGHTCPFTGKSLADHYATIVAPDAETARKLMVGIFGPQWAFQYDSVKAATPDGYPHPLVEHIRIDLTPGVSTVLPRVRELAEKWAATAAYIPLQQLGRDVLDILNGGDR